MRGLLYSIVSEGGLVEARHWAGFPPELTDGVDQRQQLPLARVLIIAQESDGSFFLLRYAKDGDWGGDTWHQTLGDAKEQATFEYGDLVSEWTRAPSDTADALSLALKD